MYMRIYFNASLAGKAEYLGEYKKIVNVIKKMGHEIVADHIMKRDYERVNQQNKEQHARDFQKAKKEIKNCDAMVVEGTVPSIGIGLLVGIALDMYKPVLILYMTIPHGLLLGDPSRLLTIACYDSKNENKLKHVIEVFFKRTKTKTLKCRFNLMINETQNNFLEWVSNGNRVSKAEILRNLIDEKITKNTVYKKMLRKT